MLKLLGASIVEFLFIKIYVIWGGNQRNLMLLLHTNWEKNIMMHYYSIINFNFNNSKRFSTVSLTTLMIHDILQECR